MKTKRIGKELGKIEIMTPAQANIIKTSKNKVAGRLAEIIGVDDGAKVSYFSPNCCFQRKGTTLLYLHGGVNVVTCPHCKTDYKVVQHGTLTQFWKYEVSISGEDNRPKKAVRNGNMGNILDAAIAAYQGK